MANVSTSDVDKWATPDPFREEVNSAKNMDVIDRNSIKAKGSVVKQIITFKGGYKTTFKGVRTETIEQGAMTHFELEDGRLVLINTPNVLCVEVIQ